MVLNMGCVSCAVLVRQLTQPRFPILYSDKTMNVDLLLSLLSFAFFLIPAMGQRYGLHALDGEPDAKPVFPTFGGAYEIIFQARFDSFVQSQCLFEFHDGTEKNRFNLITTPNRGLQLYFHDANGSYRLSQYVNDNAFEIGVVHEFRIGANATNAWIYRDDVLLKKLSYTQTLPPIVARPSQVVGDSELEFRPLEGIILGFRMKSDANPSFHDFMRYGNYPGQAFSAFTLTFHALFRNLTESPEQTVIEMYNDVVVGGVPVGAPQNHRIAVEVESGSDIKFSISDGQTTWVAQSGGSVIEGEWALWHCRVQSDGNVLIRKKGEQSSHSILFSRNVALTKILRRRVVLGNSSSDLKMLGALVGLRLEQHLAS